MGISGYRIVLLIPLGPPLHRLDDLLNPNHSKFSRDYILACRLSAFVGQYWSHAEPDLTP